MEKIERLLEHFLKTSYEDLDGETIDRTRTRILDTFGVIIAGTNGIRCDAIHELLSSKGGRKEATVLGYGNKLPTETTAFINAMMARSFDFDAVMSLTDDNKNKPAHISACSATAAIVAAEFNKSTGKELICALALGDDFASRLNACSGGGPQDVFDNTGTISGMSAVVACAKLYKLSKEQFKDALGIMLNSVSGSMSSADEYSLSFKYPIANAARNAIFATELAKVGFSSVDDPIFGPKCYFDTFGSDYDTEHFFDSIGDSFLSDIVIKPWPSCRMTHAGIDAVLTASQNKALNPDDIEGITIYLHPKAPAFIIDDFEFGRETQVHSAFNLRFTAAVAALCGQIRPENYTPEAMANSDIEKMLALVSFERDESLPAIDTAHACIALKNGTELHGSVDITPLGDMIFNPLPAEAVLSKFLLNVLSSGRISKQAADKAAELLSNLEAQDSILEVIELLS